MRRFLEELFEDDLHAKRILSLSHAGAGRGAGDLAVHRGHRQGDGVTRAARTSPASTRRKQVDRLLSNGGVDVQKLFPAWVRFVLAERKEAVVALDWTDFEADDQETLVATLITRHGRSTPLLWTRACEVRREGQPAAGLWT